MGRALMGEELDLDSDGVGRAQREDDVSNNHN
jgi:hypothetical protein